MAGHGHGDERERQLRTYMLALTVWVCLLGGSFWIYKVGAVRHAKAATGRRGATMRRVPPRVVVKPRTRRALRGKQRIRRVRRRGRPAVGTPARKRYDEAKRWQTRMRRNGHSLRAVTTGGAHDVFEVRYPAETGSAAQRRKQREHIASLRGSKALFSHLRGLGFERFAVRVGRRVVFSRPF